VGREDDFVASSEDNTCARQLENTSTCTLAARILSNPVLGTILLNTHFTDNIVRVGLNYNDLISDYDDFR
jgi:hypothetical protein